MHDIKRVISLKKVVTSSLGKLIEPIVSKFGANFGINGSEIRLIEDQNNVVLGVGTDIITEPLNFQSIQAFTSSILQPGNLVYKVADFELTEGASGALIQIYSQIVQPGVNFYIYSNPVFTSPNPINGMTAKFSVELLNIGVLTGVFDNHINAEIRPGIEESPAPGNIHFNHPLPSKFSVYADDGPLNAGETMTVLVTMLG